VGIWTGDVDGVSTLDTVFTWAKDGDFHVGKTDIFVTWAEVVGKLFP